MKGESRVFCRLGIWEETPTCEGEVLSSDDVIKLDQNQINPTGLHISLTIMSSHLLKAMQKRVELFVKKMSC